MLESRLCDGYQRQLDSPSRNCFNDEVSNLPPPKYRVGPRKPMRARYLSLKEIAELQRAASPKPEPKVNLLREVIEAHVQKKTRLRD
jgi:hypothetical protein